MGVDDELTTERPPRATEAEVVAFAAGRSVACPRCGYDLRDIQRALCPECGEPLELKIGSPRARFGWLVLAMAPGCFSGVAACFVAVPVYFSLTLPKGVGAPWPVMVGDVFGFLSAGSVVAMYRHRHRVMAWTTRRQAGFAAAVWGAHVGVFFLLLLALWLGK